MKKINIKSVRYILFLVAMVVIPSTSKINAALGDVPTQGLVGHWAFNEASGTTAIDTSGNSYNGTLVNGTTRDTGIEGSSLLFATTTGSTNNYVSFPSSLQGANFPESGSLSFWIKGDFTLQDQKCVFDCWSARSHISMRTRLGNKLQIIYQNTDGNYLNQLGSAIYMDKSITTDNTSIPLNLNTWTHVAVVWDNKNDIGSIYKDGVLAISFFWGAYAPSWKPSTQVFKINDATSAFAGNVDEVALYNRPLSFDEVSAIANSTSFPSFDTTSPTVPIDLKAASLSPSKIGLGFNASTDENVLSGYVIYRGGVPVGQVSTSSLSFVDSKLATSTTYSYSAVAYDSYGNRSATSSISIATTTKAGMLFVSNFEQVSTTSPSDIAGWLKAGPSNDAVTSSMDFVRSGLRSLKFNFDYADYDSSDISNHERSEIGEATPTEFSLGQTYWVGFSQYIPDTWVNDISPNSELVWQFHGSKGGPSGSSSPPLALYIHQDNMVISVRGATSTYYATAPGENQLYTSPVNDDKGHWVDWVVQANFNYTDGIVKVWKNGVQVVDYSGPTIYHQIGETNQKGTTFHMGVYKWWWGVYPTIVSNRTIYGDDIKFADNTLSCEDVKPNGSTQCEGIIPTNYPPTAYAGVNQTITLPSQAILSGVTTDDGLPATSTLSSVWSKVSGPGSVYFTSTSTASSNAIFSLAGTYILRLTANDGYVATSSDVSIVVNPAPDTTPPFVSITAPANGALVNRSTNVTITATSSDAFGINKVEFYVNNVLKCTDTIAPYSCVWAVPSTRGILYTLLAKAFDNNANTASTSISVTSK